MKICVILDKSEVYVNFQKNRVLRSWGVPSEDTRNILTLAEAGRSTLFGDAPTSILTLDDVNAVKSFNETIANVDADSLSGKLDSGLIILTTVPRNSTKKIEAFVKELGGTVYAPPGKSEGSIAEKLVSELNVTRSVRDVLISYVGDDYEALIPIVNSLSEIPKQYHTRITEEDIYARFPQAPGAVAPWLIEKPLLAGDTEEVIDIFRRVHLHSHFLVVISILKNKMQLAYRVGSMVQSNPKITDEKIAEILGLKSSGQVRFAKGTARTYGVEKLQQAVLVIARAEAKVKGGSAAPNVAVVETMLVELSLVLRKGSNAQR